MALLEGVYADLCGLGLPIPLSLHLQTMKLNLSSALWTARASRGGFSISLFWPTRSGEKKKTRKRCNRKRKAPKWPSNTISSLPPTGVNVNEKKSQPSMDTRKKSPKPSPSVSDHSSDELDSVDLVSCSKVEYKSVDGVHGVTYERGDGHGWTPVVRRRNCPSPWSSSEKGDVSDGSDLGIPPGPNVMVNFRILDETPGLSIQRNRVSRWTPIASRTRYKVKNIITT